ARVFLPSSVSNSYSFSTATQGRSRRLLLISSLRSACSASSLASSSRAACHCSRVPILCSGISSPSCWTRCAPARRIHRPDRTLSGSRNQTRGGPGTHRRGARRDRFPGKPGSALRGSRRGGSGATLAVCRCPAAPTVRSKAMADVNPPRLDPVSMAWNTVASYPSYEDAQAAVDRLSDERFPVENLDIVGSGLRLVERVTGRLTNARAAAAGAASGAWFGLFIGLLVGLFTSGHSFLAVAATGAALGVLWGAAFGYVAHASTKGQRDFSSVRGLVATHYDL